MPFLAKKEKKQRLSASMCEVLYAILTFAANQGANLLLTSSSSVAAHVVESAFDRHSRGKQLVRNSFLHKHNHILFF